MATLELQNITKQFGRSVIAVDGMDLEVHDGEFLVFLGPSGCGKTTAMRMIAGLEEVTEGTILLDGRDITDLEPRKRDVSMVFQNYAVWPHMTVFDNIAFALKLKKMDSDEIEKIVTEVATMTKIEPYLKRLPTQLSGGQQQRVAVARALAVSPKVFLMDEPLSNLDAKLRVSMRTELKAIHRMTGATTIFVTHDQSEAMSLADRIVVMNFGVIEQIGTPDEIYDNSASLFVADFIGTPPTNFINVNVRRDGDEIHLIHDNFEFIAEGENKEALKDYQKDHLIMGVRPENILITYESEGHFSLPCLVVEPQGSHQVVAVEIEDKIVKIVAPAKPKIEAGEIIHLTFKEKGLRFFDPDTERRI